MTSKPQVTIHTDGACIGNPGRGGYGVVLQFGEHRKELSGGYRLTTNNRMELMGPIKALQTLEQSYSVILYSDSRYVVDAIEKGWVERWRAKVGCATRRTGPSIQIYGSASLTSVQSTKLSSVGYEGTPVTATTSVAIG